MLLVMKSLPFTGQIIDLDIDSEPDASRFRWRSQTFHISLSMMVTQVEGQTRAGDDISIIFEALLKRAYVDVQNLH